MPALHERVAEIEARAEATARRLAEGLRRAEAKTGEALAESERILEAAPVGVHRWFENADPSRRFRDATLDGEVPARQGDEVLDLHRQCGAALSWLKPRCQGSGHGVVGERVEHVVVHDALGFMGSVRTSSLSVERPSFRMMQVIPWIGQAA